MFCSKCGKQIDDNVEFCEHCGFKVKQTQAMDVETSNKLARFLLTFFLGFIGSIIINHTSLRPAGWKSRTYAYFFLGIITFGIYELVASIANMMFDSKKDRNIGYFRTEGEMIISDLQIETK